MKPFVPICLLTLPTLLLGAFFHFVLLTCNAFSGAAATAWLLTVLAIYDWPAAVHKEVPRRRVRLLQKTRALRASVSDAGRQDLP